jgi:hypothetical protein
VKQKLSLLSNSLDIVWNLTHREDAYNELTLIAGTYIRKIIEFARSHSYVPQSITQSFLQRLPDSDVHEFRKLNMECNYLILEYN